MFGLLRKKTSAEVLARTIMNYAVNPGACMQMAALLRGYRVDDEVLIAEISLLRASFVRGIFRQRCAAPVYQRMADAAMAALLEAFKAQGNMNSENLRRFYDGRPAAEIVKSRMEEYAAKGDAPTLTCPIFCARTRAPGIISNIEVQRMLDDFLGAHVQKAFASVKPA